MTSRQDILTSFGHSRRPTIVVDFDGTISAIVDKPHRAQPVAGAIDALNALSRCSALVAVLSGRPVSFLQQALAGLSEEVGLIGHSGLERSVDGQIVVDPDVEPWLSHVRAAHAAVSAEVSAGLIVEDKHLSFTIHYRGAADREPEARALAERVATRGLQVETGKMHVEVRPPVAIDKGSVLSSLLDDRVDWSLYAGDDVVDLPAFAAVRASGASSQFCIAVVTDEAPAALEADADLVVASPVEMVELLVALAVARGTGSD